MGKQETPTPKGGRKRRLNVIYFVDSARTRSFTMPLGRLRVLLVMFVGLLFWSVASFFAMIWLASEHDQVSERLKHSLTTIFDYETRYDGVYEIAYPNSKNGLLGEQLAAKGKAADLAVPSDAKIKGSVAPANALVSVARGVVAEESRQPENQASKAEKPEGKSGSNSEGNRQASTTALAAKSPPAASASAPPQTVSVDPIQATAKDAVPAIVVGKPVVEARDDALELRFELTNKSSDRAEGYLWAVAEFKSDSGEVQYIGAPQDIAVQANGEATYPRRSSFFSIMRFKRKSFTFPIAKGQSGTFTGLKIGVMDRSSANKTTYNIPLEVRVGHDGSTKARTVPTGSKSG